MSVYRTFKGVERSLAKRLSVEVKCRKHLPQWLRDAIAQARRNGGISQLAVVILHQVGQRHDGDIVCLTLADFENWVGGMGESPPPGTMADTVYQAANGDEAALAWLEVMTPDIWTP